MPISSLRLCTLQENLDGQKALKVPPKGKKKSKTKGSKVCLFVCIFFDVTPLCCQNEDNPNPKPTRSKRKTQEQRDHEYALKLQREFGDTPDADLDMDNDFEDKPKKRKRQRGRK